MISTKKQMTNKYQKEIVPVSFRGNVLVREKERSRQRLSNTVDKIRHRITNRIKAYDKAMQDNIQERKELKANDSRMKLLEDNWNRLRGKKIEFEEILKYQHKFDIKPVAKHQTTKVTYEELCNG